ncbi:diguanylate cyclase domain-containing protein [Lichenicoccus sp.]|uniref:ligand-binding sensor domain-containing diguanylate cyclase n=1 Tax=Lichenicoccus sp. TaxID=2781899 RepID=UPI003D13AF08
MQIGAFLERARQSWSARAADMLAVLVVVLAAGLVNCGTASAQHLPLQIFDAQSGLTNLSIEAIAQDRTGFMYVGTEAGVFRYDGVRFAHMGRAEGLPRAGDVQEILPAPGGRIWVVFADRVFLAAGGGETMSVAVPGLPQDLPSHRADIIDGDLLLVRGDRLLRIHAGASGSLSTTVMLVQTQAPLDSVHVDHRTTWLDCGTALCRLTQGRLIPLDPALGLPPDRWTALLRDQTGTLWLRSANRIASLPTRGTRFKVIDVPGGPGRYGSDAGRLDLALDAVGDVVTQGAHGLLVHQHGAWTVYDHAGRFSYGEVTAMLRDQEGSLWLGSKARGVARAIGLGTFEDWNRASGLSDDVVWGAARDGAGTLWATTDLAVDPVVDRTGASLVVSTAQVGAHAGNVAATKAVAESVTASPQPLPFQAYAMATSPRGQLWVGVQDGELIRRDPYSGQSVSMGKLPPIRNMLADPSGPIWVGTRHGLVRIDRPDDATPALVPDLGSSDEPVFAMTLDTTGDLWVLTRKTLFHRDVRHVWQAVMQTDPLGGYQTHEMAFARDGTLWLGSFITGITRLHLDHDRVVSEDHLPSIHLASQEVEILHCDPAGRMWVGTDQGIDVTDGTSWRHLDQQDGMPGQDVDEGAVFIDHDGSPWFGTAGGLTHLLNPEQVLRQQRGGPRPVITGVSVGDVRLPFATVRSGTIHLHWSDDPLVIGFSSLAFGLSQSVHFRYRLRGVDRGWVETDAREARYPSPPPGKLVFEVMAVDPLHRLVSAPVRLIIKLQAPWWRTWAAYLALAALGAAALAAIWQLRVRYLLARQHQLEVLVEERTREIEQARVILFKQATSDSLTGLANRSAILDRLQEALVDAERTGSPLAVALLDLDHFKRVNDVFGHLAGDAVLREVGARLDAGMRDRDHAGRYGGEELLLVLPGLRPRSYERLRGLLAAVFTEPFALEQTTIRMTASMGVTWVLPGDDLTAMIRRADAALYAAKRSGRDRFVCDPPQT